MTDENAVGNMHVPMHTAGVMFWLLILKRAHSPMVRPMSNINLSNYVLCKNHLCNYVISWYLPQVRTNAPPAANSVSPKG
jgi:hypothetical protein